MKSTVVRPILLVFSGVLLAAWFLAAAGWIRSGRAPFEATLAGGSDGWSAIVTIRRDAGGGVGAEVLLDRAGGLPRSFAWELALPGQGVTCRGIARFPAAGARNAGLPACRGRWTSSREALLARSASAWVGVVWFDGTLQEARFALRPAVPSP